MTAPYLSIRPGTELRRFARLNLQPRSIRLFCPFSVASFMYQKWITAAFCVALLISATSVAESGDSKEPHSQYRVLEWMDLVPEGWEPPLVSEPYDEVGTNSIDKHSVVPELDQQLIALPGFMKPVVFDGNQVSEFLLVPLLPHHTRQHAHLDANQMLYVYLLEPVQVENPFLPVWVVGTITLEPVMTDEGPAAYRINDGVTTNYQY